jgi:hypothetical protein
MQDKKSKNLPEQQKTSSPENIKIKSKDLSITRKKSSNIKSRK